MGPLLFIIYINDVVKYITNINISLYANDIVFYWDGSKYRTEQTANLFNYWCNLNRLTLNTSKSKVVLYNKKLKHANSLIDIKIND